MSHTKQEPLAALPVPSNWECIASCNGIRPFQCEDARLLIVEHREVRFRPNVRCALSELRDCHRGIVMTLLAPAKRAKAIATKVKQIKVRVHPFKVALHTVQQKRVSACAPLIDALNICHVLKPRPQSNHEVLVCVIDLKLRIRCRQPPASNAEASCS